MNVHSLVVVHCIQRYINNKLKLIVCPIASFLDASKNKVGQHTSFNLLEEVFDDVDTTYTTFDVPSNHTLLYTGVIEDPDTEPISLFILASNTLSDDTNGLEMAKTGWFLLDDMACFPVTGLEKKIIDVLMRYNPN